MSLVRQMQRLRTYFKNRPDIQKIVGNTGWLFSDRILRLLVTLIVGSWLARYLGTQQYGQLNIAQAYIVLLMPILKMGMDSIIIRSLVNEPSEKHTILGSAIVIRLGVGVLLLPIVLLVLFALNPDKSILNILIAILAMSAFIQSFEIIDFWFQSQVESKFTVHARMISFTTSTLLKILAILFNAPLIIFGLLLLIDTLLYIGTLIILYQRREADLSQWSFQFKQAKQLIITSSPLIIAGLAVSAYMRIDQLMLAQMIQGTAGEEAVGVYASAVRISEAWYFVPTAIVSSVFPAILQSKKENLALYQKRLQRLFNLMVLISYIVGIGTTLLAPFVIRTLYGTDYSEATGLLIVLVWSGVWVSLGMARSSVLNAEDLLRFSAIATVLGVITNVILNYLTIPLWGAMGSAIATFLSYGVSAYLSSALIIKQATIPILKMQTLALIYPNPLNKRFNND